MARMAISEARYSLGFLTSVQVLHALYGYSWWLLFSGLGPFFLCLPMTSTYGGAYMVMWDDARGYCYTSDWARVMTVAFLGFMLTLIAVGFFGVVFLGLGLTGFCSLF